MKSTCQFCQVLPVLIRHVICIYPPRNLADQLSTTEHALFSIVAGLRMGVPPGLEAGCSWQSVH
eukprot:4534831-Amphidinium_carterae.1